MELKRLPFSPASAWPACCAADFGQRRSLRQEVGLAFVLYAALADPVFGILTGHRYDELPMFGVTPCPVTIFAFGVLLLAAKPLPRLVLSIPLAWSLNGGSAAVLLGIARLAAAGKWAYIDSAHRARRASGTGRRVSARSRSRQGSSCERDMNPR